MKLKFLSLSLALVLLLSVAAGCGKSKSDTAEPTPPAPTETPEETADMNTTAAERLAKYTRAYEKYSPDTVVMRVNGSPVLWSEYFSWLYSIGTWLEDYFGVTDWSANCPISVEDTKDPSNNAYASRYAALNCIAVATLMNKAEELDAGLSSEQRESLEEMFEQFRSEEDFAASLIEYFTTEDYLYAQYEAAMLYENLCIKTFGENGELCPAEDAVQYVVDQGYMYAKHILFSILDDSYQPLDEAAIAQKKADAEAVLAQLKACPAAELPTLFDSLIEQYGEDPGMRTHPDGYYFLSGDFVAPFEEAATALEVNEISGIVETDYGYHILFRPAMSADHLMDYDDQYQPYTVRSFASSALFGNIANDWYDTAEVEYTEGFEVVDLGALLAD